MRENMRELAADWRKLGHQLGFGVGVSLGYATLGMVGFEGRFDYTANGSAVNLAGIKLSISSNLLANLPKYSYFP